jgi:hypothetical protein
MQMALPIVRAKRLFKEGTQRPFTNGARTRRPHSPAQANELPQQLLEWRHWHLSCVKQNHTRQGSNAAKLWPSAPKPVGSRR